MTIFKVIALIIAYWVLALGIFVVRTRLAGRRDIANAVAQASQQTQVNDFDVEVTGSISLTTLTVIAVVIPAIGVLLWLTLR